MIMKLTQWLVTGDTHGDFSRFYALNEAVPDGEMWAVIILGDAGLNFWLNKRDAKNKYRICQKYPKLCFYCVRGNHEARPEDVEGMEAIFDSAVWNYVYWEPEYPNIAYLQDGVKYYFGDHSALVCGGSYSVDKWYRLERQAMGYYGGWFENEQLSKEEMDNITNTFKNEEFDLILAHTCPLSYQPIDLFLSFIDQDKVDNSMEVWFEDLIQQIKFNKFLFGHYHQDRIINEKARMFYYDIINLDQIL